MEEIWKDIKGYEGAYKVSDLGRVKSFKNKKERILKHGIDSNGYPNVGLCVNGVQKTKKIHKLMSIVFLNNISTSSERLVVDHIDNNKQNNRIDNLQIITNRENASKDRVNCSSKFTGVSWIKRDSKWAAHINIKGRSINLGHFKCELAAAKAYKDKLKTIDENL